MERKTPGTSEKSGNRQEKPRFCKKKIIKNTKNQNNNDQPKSV